MNLQKKDLIKKEYLRYKSLVSKTRELFSFEKKSEPKRGEIRIFGTFPPIYFLIAEEVKSKTNQSFLYKVIPLSEEVVLSHLGEDTPFFILRKRGLCLCALPFWIYLTKKFLYEYSKKISVTDEESINKCLKYAETRIIPENFQGKFIKSEFERLAWFNTISIVEYLDTTNEVDEVLLFPEIKKELESEYTYLLAAKGKKVFKGKHWYGIVEKVSKNLAQLVLYFPYFFINKKVKICLKNEVIFEGTLSTDRLIIKNFPLLSDYSFLEEELSVYIQEV
ncbi:MAG: hypothetical protein GXO57_06575 [Thermodesulfobacteria bacterium]|nr:hypothetical protein [Thermodesulfobacteriota bacterium]